MLTKELLQDLERLIPNVMQADRHVLRSRFGRLSAKFKNLSDPHPQSLEALETDYLKLLEKAEFQRINLREEKLFNRELFFPLSFLFRNTGIRSWKPWNRIRY